MGSDLPQDQFRSRRQDSLDLLASPDHLDSGSLNPDLQLQGSLEPLLVVPASHPAPEALGLLFQASPPLWSHSYSPQLLPQWLRPWLAPGGAPAFLLEAPTRSQSMLTAQPSTTLSTRLPTKSSRTTLPDRSLGMVTL